MPTLDFTTNVKLADPKAFALDFSKFSAETLGKPELYITVKVTYNETLTFGGTFDPAFQLSVVSLDNLNEELNEKYSKAFFDFFKRELNVPGDRGYVTFVDPGRGFIGHQGTTFATIFGSK
ncbi:Tautomerase/MIF superfamily [Lyophyllum atratum]|nr:Tautomerase/MIF superfamily [Lyophyllum atratum]